METATNRVSVAIKEVIHSATAVAKQLATHLSDVGSRIVDGKKQAALQRPDND